MPSIRELDGLTCPACGFRTVLAQGTVIVEVLPRNTVGVPLGRVYGRVDDSPIILGDGSPAFCNSSSCDWEGTYAEVADA